MSVSNRLEEGVEHARLHTVVGVREDSDLLRDLVRHLKSHPRDVVRQAVGIFFDDAVELRAIFLVNFYSQVEGDAIVL